jgi:hypothetical protein
LQCELALREFEGWLQRNAIQPQSAELSFDGN